MDLSENGNRGTWENVTPQTSTNEEWTVASNVSIEECMKCLFPEKVKQPSNKRARQDED